MIQISYESILIYLGLEFVLLLSYYLLKLLKLCI